MDARKGPAAPQGPPLSGGPGQPQGRDGSIRDQRIDKGRSYQEIGEDKVVMWDLDLSAYLMMNGLPPIDIRREHSEFRITFYDPEHRIRELHLRFLGSESSRFSQAVKQLKKAAHSMGQRADGDSGYRR